MQKARQRRIYVEADPRFYLDAAWCRVRQRKVSRRDVENRRGFSASLRETAVAEWRNNSPLGSEDLR
jgi:hypothetical protein